MTARTALCSTVASAGCRSTSSASMQGRKLRFKPKLVSRTLLSPIQPSPSGQLSHLPHPRPQAHSATSHRPIQPPPSRPFSHLAHPRPQATQPPRSGPFSLLPQTHSATSLTRGLRAIQAPRSGHSAASLSPTYLPGSAHSATSLSPNHQPPRSGPSATSLRPIQPPPPSGPFSHLHQVRSATGAFDTGFHSHRLLASPHLQLVGVRGGERLLRQPARRPGPRHR